MLQYLDIIYIIRYCKNMSDGNREQTESVTKIASLRQSNSVVKIIIRV